MVRMCFLCRNKAGECSLFSFPKSVERRDMWKRACDLQDYDEVSTLYVCDKHFKQEDFIEPNAKELGKPLRLKLCAVPISLTEVWEEKLIVLVPDVPIKQEMPEDPLAQTEDFEQLGLQNHEIISGNTTNQDLDEPFSPPREIVKEDVSSPRRARRHLDRANEKIAHQNRKIRNLQQNNRRLRAKIKSLEDFINQLQNQQHVHDDTGSFA